MNSRTVHGSQKEWRKATNRLSRFRSNQVQRTQCNLARLHEASYLLGLHREEGARKRRESKVDWERESMRKRADRSPLGIQVAWWLPLLVLVFRRPHREYALEFPTFLWDHKNPLTSVSGMSHLNSLTCIKESTESLVVFLIIVNLFWLHPIWNCVSIETVSLTNQISPSGPASSHNVSIFFHPLMSWSEQDKFDYQTTSGAFGTHLIISIYSVMSIDTL